MLILTPTEIRVLRVWAEAGEASPFPQEIKLFHRIKNNISGREMKLNARELEIVLHWAEKETSGHHGTDQFLLEQERLLIEKIEAYLSEQENNRFSD